MIKSHQRMLVCVIINLLLWISFPQMAREATLEEDYKPPEKQLTHEELFQNHLPQNLNRVTYKGNGSCMPYARYRSGMEIYGSANTILDRLSENLATSTQPKIGAVLVTDEGWTDHVSVVEEVSSSTISISEQNYAGLYIITNRILAKNDDSIISYIVFNNQPFDMAVF